MDAWLQSYKKTIAAASATKTNVPAAAEVIESEIDGEFHGWDGETIFKLTNGQIWQLAEYSYEYGYDYRPSVLIYKTGNGYKMKVADMAETISVKRIK